MIRLHPPDSILIIDDDTMTRETFRQMLLGEGYSVRVASTVEDGLAEVSTRTPAAILLDLHLPGTDGLVCLRRLRALPRESTIPVAILTGDYFIDEEMAREINALGARIHFKPVWENDLQRIVQELTCHAEPRR